MRYNTHMRVLQFVVCQTVRCESVPGKGVVPSRYIALEPKPLGEV